MKKLIFIFLAVLVTASAVAQDLTPLDKTPIYRRSFTARYELIGNQHVREAALSPDSTKVGFVRDNDLYIKNLATGIETRITTDGERNKIINGATDWVYEEEYAFTKAWEWSPDSRRIAFLRFDEALVPEFSMMRYDEKLYPEPYTFKYPKAGEANSIVTLHVYNTDGGTTRKIETGEQTDQYIPRIGWTPKGGRNADSELFFYRVNRLQNHFEVVLAETDGTTRTIYDETSPTYVERPDDSTVTFLEDGDRFVVRNETRTGWMHLYLYSIEKGFLNPITSGEWEVTELLGVRKNVVWYMSTELSPLSRNFYTVRLNGKNKKAITKSQYFISVHVSPNMEEFTESYSRINEHGNEWSSDTHTAESISDTPPILDSDGFFEIDGTHWDGTRINKIAGPIHGNPEFFTFVNEAGVELNGWMIKPFDFDETKKHPVFMTQYSGPGSQSAVNKEIGEWDRAIYNPLLDEGYIIACVDGRGTGGRGEAFKKSTYGALGKLETEDQISAARHLASLPYVNVLRIGIYGWSFGGFTSLNCILKGADVFKAAVAVAPVTSWRYYDTIYTEIYNGLPQDNPEGYDENSPINYAELLRGKLLLVHGTGDDNVHVQNSMEMAKALVKADKKFDMMIYPDDNHSMWPSGSRHVREKIVDWVINNL
jgi:dipeptidyl-peptidase-4